MIRKHRGKATISAKEIELVSGAEQPLAGLRDNFVTHPKWKIGPLLSYLSSDVRKEMDGEIEHREENWIQITLTASLLVRGMTHDRRNWIWHKALPVQISGDVRKDDL